MPSVQNFGSCIEFCVDSDGTESVGAYLVKISSFELNPITLADLVGRLSGVRVRNGQGTADTQRVGGRPGAAEALHCALHGGGGGAAAAALPG